MTDYWHGGRRGIAVGGLIRSPHERRHEWSTRERQAEAVARLTGYNADRNPKLVYFTTDRDLARAWAATHFEAEGGGSLYRVRPLPPSSLETDTDYEPVGFSARRAEVLEVVEDLVAMGADAADAAIGRYATWEDYISPMYDADGYMLPPPAARALGAPAEMFRHFGRWFSIPPGCVVGIQNGRAVVGPKPVP
ncbi:hypothetical protein [Mycolicibacterium llatzerense]|uniref:hypothetical protein n=1 Tax=Mycolicibacterium llatzerense TaxID=280871 RepID=UPI0008DD5F5F|nr:hypothetical protein [Mycolicibacterium llatzerense]